MDGPYKFANLFQPTPLILSALYSGMNIALPNRKNLGPS